MPDRFHHAYNFVPTPDRNDLALPGELADHTPVMHDHLAPELYNGTLEVALEVVTPLVVGDPAPIRGSEHRAIYVPSRSGAHSAHNGADAAIPVTSVKGMLRSTYEAVTLSRFGHLGPTDQTPLTYRARAANALGLVPARVDRHSDALVAILLRGAPSPGHPDIAPAALWLASDRAGDRYISSDARAQMHALNTGARIDDAELTLVTRNPGTALQRDEWVLTHLNGNRVVAIDPTALAYPITHRLTPETPGWLHCTGTDLIATKHSERIFFHSAEPETVPIDPVVIERYRTVMTSYQDLQPLPVQRFDPQAPLQPGDLAYAILDEKGTLLELVPTMIGRRAFQCSPGQLARSRGMDPAESRGHASMADQAWGFAHERPHAPSADLAHRLGDRADAHRGLITLGPITPLDATLDPGAYLLRELAAPKPSAARFYVYDPQGRPIEPVTGVYSTDFDGDRLGLKEEFFGVGDSLPRKVYPHHRSLTGHTAFPESAIDTAGEPGERNVTIKSHIRPGSRFTFRVDFCNLNRLQLAALVWVLDSTSLATADADAGYHRLGHGRPLGLGSVRLDVTALRTVTGADLADAYTTLTGCLGTAETKDNPTDRAAEFDAYVQQAAYPPLTQAVQAVRRAASGYPDDDRVPVRYPHKDTGGKVGTVIPWFTWNERVQYQPHKGLRIPPGRANPLPPLWDTNQALPWNPPGP
ncbi:TIGR03986 family type III CRISPR-associated RAMP protein [Granulicoccus sp. GXG6511]|uniref:TIGR03986 family type III CRISPR-associated RAMP protein n=1 Tax=Granulicoccus sp. GXG6511 TaxID=3381351 RepID=UPI003D7DA2C0